MFSKHSLLFVSISVIFLSITNLSHAQTWTQFLSTGSIPTTRYVHAAVYDAPQNRMTIFGGTPYSNSGLNDVWVLSTANGLGGTPGWTQLFPTGSAPTAREFVSAVSDTTNNIMMFFGGYDGKSTLGDVWTLSYANGLGGTPGWTQIFPSGSTLTARAAHSAVYNYVNNQMIIFGGRGTDKQPYFNDVWVLGNANGLDSTTSAWTLLFPTGSAPTTRAGHVAVYDNPRNRMTIFGGGYIDSATVSHFLNDVWVLTNANGLGGTPTWTQLLPTGGPPQGRLYPTSVYDTAHNIMTIFGGAYVDSSGTVSHYLNDVWELSNANGLGGTPVWNQIFPAGNPPAERFGQSAVYDNANNRMTIFGGTNVSNVYNDTYVLTVANGVPVNDWMLYSTEMDELHSHRRK